jgi:hypothetical protein
MPSKTALARRRASRRRYAGARDRGSAALKRARSTAARARSRYKASRSRDQYTQLGWTLGGGAIGGLAAGMDIAPFGIDPRLSLGLALAATSILVKSPAIKGPACGLAGGLLAGWISDTTTDVIGGADDEEII